MLFSGAALATPARTCSNCTSTARRWSRARCFERCSRPGARSPARASSPAAPSSGQNRRRARGGGRTSSRRNIARLRALQRPVSAAELRRSCRVRRRSRSYSKNSPPRSTFPTKWKRRRRASARGARCSLTSLAALESWEHGRSCARVLPWRSRGRERRQVVAAQRVARRGSRARFRGARHDSRHDRRTRSIAGWNRRTHYRLRRHAASRCSCKCVRECIPRRCCGENRR